MLKFTTDLFPVNMFFLSNALFGFTDQVLVGKRCAVTLNQLTSFIVKTSLSIAYVISLWSPLAHTLVFCHLSILMGKGNVVVLGKLLIQR